MYIKGRTSFRNAWTVLVNLDLLKECNVRTPTHGEAVYGSIIGVQVAP